MNSVVVKNRTNVRFIVSAAICFALGGCAAPSPLARGDACGFDAHAVCATRGGERSCGCIPGAEVDRFLATFGEPAWLGGAH
jgi:hypothetical protein